MQVLVNMKAWISTAVSKHKMFGVVFKTFNGRYEMALRKLFTSKKHAESAMKALTVDFSPELAKRYSVVECSIVN